jgi:hypothetical protein
MADVCWNKSVLGYCMRLQLAFYESKSDGNRVGRAEGDV